MPYHGNRKWLYFCCFFLVTHSIKFTQHDTQHTCGTQILYKSSKHKQNKNSCLVLSPLLQNNIGTYPLTVHTYTHIIQTVWKIQTSIMVFFLHTNSLKAILFKAKLRKQNTQLALNIRRLCLALTGKHLL
jgi:hypothetical protein